MKYSEIIRDISTKPGDWYFYDKQFEFVTYESQPLISTLGVPFIGNYGFRR